MIDNPTEWFKIRIVQLENESKKNSILMDMKSMVLNSERAVLSDIAHNVSIQPLFDYLNNASTQDTELMCTIIFEILNQLAPKELINIYSGSIHTCLHHQNNDVNCISLKLLEKCIGDDTIDFIVTQQTQLIIDAVGSLGSEERSTAQCGISMFTKLGGYPSGANVLFSNEMLKKLKEVMAKNDISRFRVYEMIVAVSKISSETFQKAVSSGLMGDLVAEVFSSDILIQLNALEILSTLAASNHGLNYLTECNIIQELISKLLKIKSEDLSLILLPGLIEFVGTICAQQPEQFVKEYPDVITLLLSSVETSDESLLGVIYSTVGKIGSSCSGRLVLAQQSKQINSFFALTTRFLSNKNELAITILNSLCELLKKINGTPCNDITENWFLSMGPNAVDTIVSLAKLPFAEFRLSALTLLKTVASHSWGAIKLHNFPGMIEYLLDRSSEFNKDCKLVKYEIVCNIVDCQNVEEFISSNILHNLREFVKEGPYYVPIEVETATEGAS